VNRREAFTKIFHGMRADVHDYSRLRELLEVQFAAALRHRTEEIREVGERIVELVSVLDARRRERVQLASHLSDSRTGRVTMSSVAARLQGTSRSAFDACWSALEAAVQECKALNMRNCRLLMDQHDIMQRVLNAEADTYAPA
jgi:flagellar biosynthesis protein FlgN